jgi:hypothetical protein
MFEPLLDKVQVAKLLSSTNLNTKLKENDERYRCILDHVEAAEDEVFGTRLRNAPFLLLSICD